MTVNVTNETFGQVTRQPSMESFIQTVHAFHKTEALKAAIQLDLFTAVGEAGSVDQIASRCNASARGIRILCDYLVMIGLLEKEKDLYALTPDSKAFLDRNSPYYAGGSIEFMLSPATTDGFKDLASVVRKGTTTEQNGGLIAPEHPAWVTYARAMAPMVKMPAESLASTLGTDVTPSWKVLDIAAGHGLFGIAVAKRYPNSRVVELDWQNVLSIARENAAAAGVSDRVSFLPGDALEVGLGSNYDVVLLPNFLHHFGLETIETFLSKIFKALRPGGRVAILEVIPNEDRISPPLSIIFSLIMLATTKEGNAYTFSEYQEILSRMGFSKVETRPLGPTPFSVITAQKSPVAVGAASV